MHALRTIMQRLRQRAGMALVIVLLALAILVPLVTEYVYDVYVNTELLNNWRLSQRLSLAAQSGTSLAVNLASKFYWNKNYNAPGSYPVPPIDPTGDGIFVSGLLEDENGKFNLNSLITSEGKKDEYYFAFFQRLLVALGQERDIADRVKDYLDPDSLPDAPGSEDDAKNGYFDCVEELLLVKGIDRKTYGKLKDYITAIKPRPGQDNDFYAININAAKNVVIWNMTQYNDRHPDIADGIVKYRDEHPFEDPADLQKVPGFEVGTEAWEQMSNRFLIKGRHFSFTITAADESGLKRVVKSIVDTSGNVRYWREQ